MKYNTRYRFIYFYRLIIILLRLLALLLELVKLKGPAPGLRHLLLLRPANVLREEMLQARNREKFSLQLDIGELITGQNSIAIDVKLVEKLLSII